LALNSAEKRLRLVLLMVVLLHRVAAFHLNTLSDFWGPPLPASQFLPENSSSHLIARAPPAIS